MVDLEPIPLADDDRTSTRAPLQRSTPGGQSIPSANLTPRRRQRQLLAWGFLLLLAVAHGLAIWRGMGGLEGLTGDWPLWRDDHSLYYHSALVTQAFLKQSGTTAGYDPYFMAGYPKSVIFPASSTLPELVVWSFGGNRPEVAYKAYVLISSALLPWLIALASWVFGLRARGVTLAVLCFLLYLWTDFPINYASFGMLPYLLAIPLSLLALGAFASFLCNGGFLRWLGAALLLSLAFLVHLTTAMLLAPAAAMAYVAALKGEERDSADDAPASTSRLSLGRHLAVWMLPVIVLAANAFWWLPGLWLASTKGVSGFVLAHSREHVYTRLLQIVTVEAEAEAILIGLGLLGLVVLWRQSRIVSMALGGYALAGFFWGYLAGAFPALDFLQPGRHTYALYAGLAVAGGAGLDAVLRRLRGSSSGTRLDLWVLLGLILVGLRVLGPPLFVSLRTRLFVGEPFLSSRPSPRLIWVVDRVKTHLKPGERLLYEEGGKDLPGIPDPYQRGRFSGLLPERTGVELIGGPYLHASLATNFTQFGEGALFGKTDWELDDFQKYARLYRPAAILCWSPRARGFCRAHPDLITILEDDGTLLLGKVQGYDGATIDGKARVTAEAGQLRVSEMTPGLDGSIVLRYHSVPGLRVRPPIPLEPRREEGDPVPFIGLRPPPGVREVELELVLPLRRPPG
jgi:hypothetical protein